MTFGWDDGATAALQGEQSLCTYDMMLAAASSPGLITHEHRVSARTGLAMCVSASSWRQSS